LPLRLQKLELLERKHELGLLCQNAETDRGCVEDQPQKAASCRAAFAVSKAAVSCWSPLRLLFDTAAVQTVKYPSMNYGPLIFLAAFFALASSWFGFVLTPQMQVGQLQQTNTVPDGAVYPLGRPGLAKQGLDVYRANGCASCHSQQVRQTGMTSEVRLTDIGTNEAAVVKTIAAVKTGFSGADLKSALPLTVLRTDDKPKSDALAKALGGAGAKAEVWIVPLGPDLERGWGKRRTIAEDFIFDSPVMLGSQRIGPDLANVGLRWTDPNWHLRHLYAPAFEVKDSPMPPYRFLFEKRRIERVAAPDALALSGELAPEPGYEIVPKPQARALVAYLTSLHANEPLFEAPLTLPAPAPASTNAAPAGATNAPAPTATNAPAK
jgi:cbb3-type cytochrome oxidase cytochrome c subunit